MRPFARNAKNGEVTRVVLRRLHEWDLPVILHLQTLCAQSLEDPSVFVCSSESELRAMMRSGEVYGAFASKTLVACAAVFLPQTEDEDLARDVVSYRLPPTGNAVLDTCFVHPDYRCNGLARDLVHHCARRAFDELDAQRILCTVSPKNHASLRAMFSVEGMRILALRQKYGGRLRYILCLERAPKTTYTVFERLPLTDVYAVSRALADGYVGFSLYSDGKGSYLWVAK